MSDSAFLWTLTFLEQQCEKEKPFFFQNPKTVLNNKAFFLRVLLLRLKQLSNRGFQNVTLLLKIGFVFAPRKKKH